MNNTIRIKLTKEQLELFDFACTKYHKTDGSVERLYPFIIKTNKEGESELSFLRQMDMIRGLDYDQILESFSDYCPHCGEYKGNNQCYCICDE